MIIFSQFLEILKAFQNNGNLYRRNCSGLKPRIDRDEILNSTITPENISDAHAIYTRTRVSPTCRNIFVHVAVLPFIPYSHPSPS